MPVCAVQSQPAPTNTSARSCSDTPRSATLSNRALSAVTRPAKAQLPPLRAASAVAVLLPALIREVVPGLALLLTTGRMQCRLTSSRDTPKSCQSSPAVLVNLHCNSTAGLDEIRQVPLTVGTRAMCRFPTGLTSVFSLACRTVILAKVSESAQHSGRSAAGVTGKVRAAPPVPRMRRAHPEPRGRARHGCGCGR